MNTQRVTPETLPFTEVTNFKTFLKENYPVIYTKKMLNMDLNILLTVLMEFANIRHS